MRGSDEPGPTQRRTQRGGGFSPPGAPRAPRGLPPQPAAAQTPRAEQPRHLAPRATSPHRPRPTSHFPVPPSQRWLFAIMLVLVVVMATYLIRLRERARDRLAAAAASLPLTVAETREEPLRLYLANDADGSLAEKPIRFPLPLDPNARARVALEKLLEEYAAPGSQHPLHSPPDSVEEIYLLPVPGFPSSASRLAVVNLTSAFVQSHPSGIEPETLTLLSMIATLRANLPSVTQVRFLVEGQAQATLAGHADLSHAYLAAGTEMAPPPEAPPDSPDRAQPRTQPRAQQPGAQQQ